MYRDFWRLLVKEWGKTRLILTICGITVGVSVLEGLNIGLLVPLLETLNSPNESGNHWVSRGISRLLEGIGLSYNLGTILVALGILIVGTSVLKYLRTNLITRAEQSFTVWLRSRSMHGLLDADMSYFHQKRIGILSDTLTTQTAHAGTSISRGIEIIANLGIAFTYLLTAYLIAPVLATVALGMMLALFLGMRWHIRRSEAFGTVRLQKETELQASSIETLTGIHVVKSFLLERLKWGEFSDKAEEVGKAHYTIRKNVAQMSVIQETSLFGLIAVVVFVGVSVLNLGIAVIVTLLFILYRLAPRISSTNNRRGWLVAALVALNGVKETTEQASKPNIKSGDKIFSDLQQGVSLDNVAFSYTDGSMVLRDANFTIEKGKITAITGSSGAGKTTIIDLLLRYYDPVKGTIFVDGTDVRNLDLASWRKAIGVVSQDVFLFNDSIANNIGLGRPGVQIEHIVDAAKKAYAHEFIQHLPDGYETQVGDRGWNLSGGQRQRLSLARAILETPDILILDEATSALDSEAERLVQEYVNQTRGTFTVVLVAHRMSTIQIADKIVVLENGKIIEEGDWASMTELAGALATARRLQSTE